jgi:hypothetical protein
MSTKWIPVLIQLNSDSISSQEVGNSNFIINFLESQTGFLERFQDWRSVENLKLLFIFDGCDELLLNSEGTTIIARFFQKIWKFQDEHQQFQILLTSRSLALQGLQDYLDRSSRAIIQRMNREQQEIWLNKWVAIFEQYK